jgi:hypothetical protein
MEYYVVGTDVFTCDVEAAAILVLTCCFLTLLQGGGCCCRCWEVCLGIHLLVSCGFVTFAVGFEDGLQLRGIK